MYILHIPGEQPHALRWNINHETSSYGSGALIFRNSNELLDGATFRALRQIGARLETDNPHRARLALRLMQDESLGDD